MSTLSINHLSLTYLSNKQTTINNLNFKIHTGQLAIIKGDNGKGKTSLLQILCGAIPNYIKGHLTGDIIYNNTKLTYNSLVDASHIFGYMMQDPEKQICFPFLEEELFFGAENLERNKEEFFKDFNLLIDLFPFLKNTNQETNSLSFGQKKILIFASLILKDPVIFLLDEPGAGLSEDNREKFILLVNNLKNKSKIILITEHHNIFDKYANLTITL
ncbi:MAG: ABC transporter ATP-binding protein [Candidatus Cloacimonetes bacterium]|jgi:energy-coupling factor transporter ATP-binding protein EcfA2|nr:energy-coupling factor ABC transporter ATP-binding protein [Candidatus Cloacimonadota bacterium]MDD4155987.1 ABC transporter ATP-binding protein [Candidatus Cloacimonadota bacterium]